jgi:hypothetical protein
MMTSAERIRSLRRRRARGERGAVQIEFVLSFMITIFIMFSMWELVMIVHTMNVLSDAAKEGIRCAVVSGRSCNTPPPGCPFDPDKVKCRVWSFARLSFHDMSGLTITMTPSTIPAPGERVRIVVSYPFVPFTALPFNPTIPAAAEGRVVF